MPSRCFGCSLLSVVHSWKHWTTFTSFSWLSCVMKDRVFRCSVRHFSASSSELRPFVSGLPINSQGLWTYAFRLKDRVNNNNNNNNTIWGGSVLTGEEPPPHSGELKHALSPNRRPNPIPAIPPYVVRTPHLHGAPTTEETVKH